MRCEDGDLVPAILEADCGIDDQALRPANAQVRVEEDDVFLLFRHRVFKERERGRRSLRVAMHEIKWAAGDLSALGLVSRRARRMNDDLEGCT